MSIDYPDIIGEYVTAPNRFEVDGLQYIGECDPKAIPMGESSNLVLYLQNTYDLPLKISIKLQIPQSGRFRGHPMFAVASSEIEITLGKAEVGYLIIPMATTSHISPGDHEIGVEFKVQHGRKPTKVRKPKTQNPFQSLPIGEVAGLNLVGVLGVTYKIQNGKKVKFPLKVSKQGTKTDPDDVPAHEYQKIWDVEIGRTQQEAQVDVNENRVRILEKLKVEPLFISFYLENHRRFIDCGVSLKLGEAIALAKLLTFTAHLFLSKGELQDGLLCPIWERAIIHEFPTADPLEVVRVAGYEHILRLSLALSFGMIAQAYGKQPWVQEEREGVIDLLVSTLEQGESLEVDFLYLPLMMAALNITQQVRLPDEDMDYTFKLIKQARESRDTLFVGDDMAEANNIYNTLLQKAMAG